MSLLTKIDAYIPKGALKLAEAAIGLHPATPLITADKELNPLVSGAVPDYKATAISLASTVLKHEDRINILNKSNSNALKDLMVLVGIVRSLRPFVQYVRDTPLLWAFIPKRLKQGIDLVLRIKLPVVDDGAHLIGTRKSA